MPKMEDTSLDPAGLVNLNNTCYINTILQLLVRLPTVIAIFRDKPHGRTSGEFEVALENFLESMTIPHLNSDERTAISFVPLTLLVLQVRKLFSGTESGEESEQQQDAHELLILILDVLWERAVAFGNYAPGSSFADKFGAAWFSDNFEGTTMLHIACKSCAHCDSTPENWRMLQVHVNGDERTVQDAIAAYIECEDLPEARCDLCGNVGKQARREHHSLPQTLFIHAMLFAHDGSKIRQTLHANEVIGISVLHGNESVTFMFELVGVALHGGESLENGHYCACIRAGQKNDQFRSDWFNVNDNEVERIPAEYTDVLFDEVSYSDVTPYIYLYVRKEIVEGGSE